MVRNYVVPDVARRVADSLRAWEARGAYDDYATEVSFAHRLNRDLRALAGDPQLDVEYVAQLRWPLPPPTPAPPAWVHCGLGPARVMADGVGSMTLYGFRWPEFDCSHRVAEAMQAVAGARALILDLREAGDELRPEMAYVASYLVAGCTHLGDLWDRRTGATEALWTHDGLPGPAFGGMKPLVLLTSARTFAAAEELAYALQHLGRATVVGERTGGGAHTSAVGAVGEHLIAHMPVGRVSNPTTGTNWQGVGVQPDVPVPEGEALATAQRLIRDGRVRAGRVPPAPRGSAGPTRPGGVRALAPGGVEVTSVVVLRRPTGDGRTRPNGFLEMLTPRRPTAADVDPARLVLPAGYAETRWPGSAGGRGLRAPSRTTAARWRTLEDEASQRARAACGQAWLADPSGGRSAAP